MEIKHTNGIVNCLYKSGSSFVKTELSIEHVRMILRNGEITDSDREDYPICIDNEWYFESETPSEEVKSTLNKRKRRRKNV